MQFSFKISKKAILYFIAFFFLIKPQYYSYISGFTSIYNPGMIAVAAIIIVKSVLGKRMTKQATYILAITLFPVLSSIIEGVSANTSMFLPVVQVVSLTLLLQYGLKKDFDKCLGAFAFILELYSYINFLTIVLFPEGIYETSIYSGHYWFLGYKNVMIRFLLPAICVNVVYTIYKEHKYTARLISLIVIACLSEVITDCKTGSIGLIFVVVIMMLMTRKKLPAFLNLKNGAIAIGVFSMLLATTSFLNLFSELLALIGEDASLLNRQVIWIRAVELFMDSPIWGYGLRTTEGYRQLLNTSTGWADFSHPHNFFLYVLIQGGLINLLLVFGLFFRTSKKCLAQRENFASKMLILTYASFFIMGIVESLVGATLLYPLAMIADYALEKPIYYVGTERLKQ